MFFQIKKMNDQYKALGKKDIEIVAENTKLEKKQVELEKELKKLRLSYNDLLKFNEAILKTLNETSSVAEPK